MSRFLRERFGMIALEEDGGAGGTIASDGAAGAADAAAGGDTGGDTDGYTPHAYQAQGKGELKNDEFFKDYSDITAVMTGLKDSNTKISELQKQIEDGKASPIESTDSYKMLDNTAIDGVSFKKEEVEEMQATALALSATQEQFESIVKAKAEEKKAFIEFRDERRDASLKLLRDAWPSETEFNEGWERFNRATSGLEAIGVKGVKQLMNNPNYGDNAVLIRILSEFGRFFQDDKLLDGNGGVIDEGNPGQLSYPSMK